MMIIVNNTELNYDAVNDIFTSEALALSEDSVNEAWEKYVEFSSNQGDNIE